MLPYIKISNKYMLFVTFSTWQHFVKQLVKLSFRFGFCNNEKTVEVLRLFGRKNRQTAAGCRISLVTACWLCVCLSAVLRHGCVQFVHSAAVQSLHVLLRCGFRLYGFRSVQLHQWVSECQWPRRVFELVLIQSISLVYSAVSPVFLEGAVMHVERCWNTFRQSRAGFRAALMRDQKQGWAQKTTNSESRWNLTSDTLGETNKHNQ